MSIKDKLQNRSVKTYPVELPDLEETIYLRKLTVKELGENISNSFEICTIMSCCDENGNALFEPSEYDSILASLNYDEFQPMLEKFMEINKLVIDGKVIEEAKKN